MASYDPALNSFCASLTLLAMSIESPLKRVVNQRCLRSSSSSRNTRIGCRSARTELIPSFLSTDCHKLIQILRFPDKTPKRRRRLRRTPSIRYSKVTFGLGSLSLHDKWKRTPQSGEYGRLRTMLWHRHEDRSGERGASLPVSQV